MLDLDKRPEILIPVQGAEKTATFCATVFSQSVPHHKSGETPETVQCAGHHRLFESEEWELGTTPSAAICIDSISQSTTNAASVGGKGNP